MTNFLGAFRNFRNRKDVSRSPRGQTVMVSIGSSGFNSQASRWKTDTCGGGLHWRVFPSNKGYSYKTPSQMGAFSTLVLGLRAVGFR